jgi:hypothetical protein
MVWCRELKSFPEQGYLYAFFSVMFCDRRGFVIVDMFCRGKDMGKEMHIIQKTWPATGCKSKKKKKN